MNHKGSSGKTEIDDIVKCLKILAKKYADFGMWKKRTKVPVRKILKS